MKFLYSSLLSIIFTCFNINAAIIQHGALTGNSDNNYILDSKNNSAWTRFDALLGYSWDEALEAMSAGGEFEGYYVASIQETSNFMNALSSNTSNCSSTFSVWQQCTLPAVPIDLLGDTDPLSDQTSVLFSSHNGTGNYEIGYLSLDSSTNTFTRQQRAQAYAIDESLSNSAAALYPTSGWLLKKKLEAEQASIGNISGNDPLENTWEWEGNGSVSRTSGENNIGEDIKLLEMNVSNVNIDAPITLSTEIDVPLNSSGFSISFDYLFETATGHLDVSINDTLFTTLTAQNFWSVSAGELLNTSFWVDDPSIYTLDSVNLDFSLYPGSPSSMQFTELLIDTTQQQVSVPSPNTLSIFGLSLFGILISRKVKLS